MKRSISVVFGIALVAALAACSGGGSVATSSSAGANGGLGAVQPLSVPTPGTAVSIYDVHVIIDESVGNSIGVVVHNVMVGGRIRPLPFAIIYYPDGSIQIADENGTFSPADSSYFDTYGWLLESNPDGTPYLVIADPAGLLPSIVTQLDVAPLTQFDNPQGIVLQNSYAHILSSGVTSLAAIGVHPAGINTIDGHPVTLSASGIDTDGHAASLANAGVQWSTPKHGQIVPYPGTAYARYIPPKSGSGTDTFEVSVRAAGHAQPFRANGAITFVDPASLVKITGRLADASGAAANATAAFVQREGVPGNIHPFYWFGTQASDGTFSALVPKNTTLLSLAQGGSPPAFHTARGATGSAQFRSPSQPNAVPFPFWTALDSAPFVDGAPAPPPIASYIRDAWYASALPQDRHIFDADSGLQPLLATPGKPESGSVTSGLFRGWRFEWSSVGDEPLLTIVETAGAGGGRQAATISQTGRNAYAFARYYAPQALSLAAPLIANQSGAQLQSDGAWIQTGTYNSAFTARVAQKIYSTANQKPGAPLYLETLRYAREASGASALGDTLTNGAGVPLWALDVKRTPAADRSYRYSAAMTRYYGSTRGRSTVHFTLSGQSDADGGGSAACTNADTGVTTAFTLLPAGSGELRASNGAVRDAAGSTLATFRITSSNLVEAIVGAEPGYDGSTIAFEL